MTAIYPIWDGRIVKPVEREFKISLCTTCMGRLHDLEQTLPINLELNARYPNLEFVILDYNSPDGLNKWMQRHMRSHIDSGRVVYYRTEEPRYYSMTHSRNVAFKLATGDIVTNVDADNFTVDLRLPPSSRPELCFAEYLNLLTNQQEEKLILAKGKQLMRGRLGFHRREFIDVLGGYDEQLIGYGRDDHDLRDRAWELGFTLFRFGGAFVSRIKTLRSQKGANMEIKDWRLTERRNAAISAANITAKRLKANEGVAWGKARVQKNFSEWIEV